MGGWVQEGCSLRKVGCILPTPLAVGARCNVLLRQTSKSAAVLPGFPCSLRDIPLMLGHHRRNVTTLEALNCSKLGSPEILQRLLTFHLSRDFCCRGKFARQLDAASRNAGRGGTQHGALKDVVQLTHVPGP
jgi:hypothetical protein